MANIYNSQLDAYSLYHKAQEEQTSSAFGGPALPALGHALAGSTGTAISNLAVYPLDLIITRLQVQRQFRRSSFTPDEAEYKGVLDAFEQIYNKEGGLSAFYTGVLQDTGKSTVDSFLFFLFYNYLRTSRLQKHGKKSTTLPALDDLAIGALAGAFSKFFTTPISNIVTRKQTASMVSARSGSKTAESSVADIASSIRSEKGIQGFWSGYSASLVLTLNPSITFFLYETFKRYLISQSQRNDPGARLTFLMAAVSKAIASTITYPFSLAKARAQTSFAPPVKSDFAEIVKDEIEHTDNQTEAENAMKDVKKIAKRSTVFNTIFHIYRTEGPAALYEGVFGEILKGFFSHGITMIVKEAIHKFIIQAYYLILKALKKYPSPAEIATQAGKNLHDAGTIVREGYGNVSERVGNVVQDGKEAFSVVGERINSATEAAKKANSYSSRDAGHLLGNAREQLGDKIDGAGKGIKPEKKE